LQPEGKTNVKREKSIVSLGGALLLLAILATYANHFHNSFHFDDWHTIVNNTSIRELRNVPLFFRDATTFSAVPSTRSYRPLVSTLLAIDYQLGHGLQPFWFHLSIFALFIALALLVAFVIHHLLEYEAASSRNRWIALAAAAWYALEPANADTINYIIACSEVMSALGIIASFAVYVAFPRIRRYHLYILPAAIAILAKPPAAIFAVLFALFRLLFPDHAIAGSRPQARAWLFEAAPAFVACAVVLLLVKHMTPVSWSPGIVNAHDYLVTQPYVALLYFKTFFWPTGISAVYDLKPFVTFGDARLWIGFAFLLFISAAAIVAAVFNKTRVIGFGLLWFLIALLPTSLFPLAEVMNDHRTFLPYIGLVIAIAGAAALLVARLDRQRRWAKIAATCAVALFLCANAYATFQRNKVWKTEETLWHDVVLKSPRNGIGLMSYGIALVNKGDLAGALDYFHRAQQLIPENPVLLVNLAILEDATKQTAAAEQHFKEALRLAPSFPAIYAHYARYLLSHARTGEARALLRTALQLSPNDLYARELFVEAEKRTDGVQRFDAAPPAIGQTLNPTAQATPESYLALSVQLYGEERYIEAIFACRRALDLRPGYAQAWNNMGIIYNKLGRYEEAAAACQRALLYNPRYESAQINLQYARAKLRTSGK
jgi:tetratricopeptide (TPR) repeat protein